MKKPDSHISSSLRVLLVSPLPPPNGGIGRWTVLLRSWLAERPHIATRIVDISPRWRAVEDLAVWKRLMGGLAQGARDAWRCLVKMITFRPQVMHVNTSAQLRGPWDTVMLAVAWLLGVRSVYHLRIGRLPEIMRRKGWEWWGMRGALKLADRVIVLDAVSEQAMQNYLPANRVVRLANAISFSNTTPNAHQHEKVIKTVLFLGHIIPTKGMVELMTAWRALKPQGWRLRLGGLGSPEYQATLKCLVGEDAAVEFLGDLSAEQAAAEMQTSDLFVLPTHTEGFPNVLLEAMAVGKAIVSTDVGAIAEMLDAGSQEPCGVVIPPRDSEALAGAMQRLMDDQKLREALGRRAQAKAARCYSAEVVFARLVDLWSEAARPEMALNGRRDAAVMQ